MELKHFTEKEIRHKYEEYKLNWMIRHNHLLPELINELGNLLGDYDEPIWDVYPEWEKSIGFGGEIWASFNEWLDNEGNQYAIDWAFIKAAESWRQRGAVDVQYEFHDTDHLDCFWYGGDIITITFSNGWKLVIGAYGDIRVDDEFNGHDIYYVDKNNSGNAFYEFHNIMTDEDLRNIEFGDNNWWEVDAIAPDGKFIDLCSCDNVLDDNLLDNFETDLTDYLQCAKEIYKEGK